MLSSTFELSCLCFLSAKITGTHYQIQQLHLHEVGTILQVLRSGVFVESSHSEELKSTNSCEQRGYRNQPPYSTTVLL